ncbi:hypothetical protein AWJ20_2759 [Sugiyamaella lignohabitans]|uniref:Uncharacterized protein n=1 Tax=Sugiyamaella lignohabitans TaxID=796027 RepID=A0A161HMQ2_9ASCO|nr:uncharacterized protein AWJ20_2759 [Sugiyamaella lignohabitans]ANB15137.1 hypothetical protein AWJ20_2759 [Sugiyamaella lignohabitans]
MRFSSLLAAAVAVVPAFAAPSPASPTAGASNANQVVTALGAIQSQLVSLQSNVDNFDGGLFDIVPLLNIQNGATTLGNKINSATSLIKKQPTAYSQSDTLTISTALLGFVPNINTTLVAIIDKKSVFDHSILDLVSVSWLVYNDITTLHTDTTNLANALQAKFDPVLVSAVTQIVNEINGWFSQAESVYAGSGLIDLKKREELSA